MQSATHLHGAVPAARFQQQAALQAGHEPKRQVPPLQAKPEQVRLHGGSTNTSGTAHSHMRWLVALTCDGWLHALVRRSVAASEPSEPLRHDGTDHLPTRGIEYGVGTFEGVQTTLSGGVIRPPSTTQPQ
jgi:hypothetical protein